MINLPDDISVHVFKGVKLMDIYDKTTGFPRLDEELARLEDTTSGADRDGDFLKFSDDELLDQIGRAHV